MSDPVYAFLKETADVLNAGQARTVLLAGNVTDLFYEGDRPDGAPGRYVPLVDLLSAKWRLRDRILVVLGCNGAVKFASKEDREKVKEAWLRWRTGIGAGGQLAVKRLISPSRAEAELRAEDDAFEGNLRDSVGKPALALEMLRQMCLCSRAKSSPGGDALLEESLIILVEGADMLVPEAEISRLSEADRLRVIILQEWFSDPEFINGRDIVALLTESRSLMNQRIAGMPQVIEVEIPSPDEAVRRHFIDWFDRMQPAGRKIQIWGTPDELAALTAGLSIHALMQLLKASCYGDHKLTTRDVVAKVEAFIKSQLGDDVVEFKKPTHSFDDVVGCSRLKAFIREELMPRFLSAGPDSLPGAAVCGPIGGGKTFLFEAMAAQLGIVVLVLKNFRSMWYGQSDVIVERLKRVLYALSKALIFVDEADTQFGGVGRDVHETERRLTGKFQALMSDPPLRGRIIWLLITARIHLLSPDMRRPGRVGDLVIPVLDPEGEDRRQFVRWVLKPVLEGEATEEQIRSIESAGSLAGYSAASFQSLRSELIAKSKRKGAKLALDEVFAVAADCIPPAIAEARRFQTLQALVNCTRRRLLPDPAVTDEQRNQWDAELRVLEARGVR